MNSQKRQFSVKFMLFFLLIFTGAKSFSQTEKSLLWEPEFDVTLPSDNKFAFTFGMANRYLFVSRMDGERINESEQQHFELNQFTKYKTGSNSSVSLGFRYRFREVFEDSRHDEFRIIEQFNYSHPESFLNFGHRFRFEQRFRDLTIYRLRYRIGIARPLSEEFGIGFSTEFLYSMIKDVRPATDQRFTVELENSSFENLELSAGVELRREDYTGVPASEIYFLTGASLKL